MELLQSPVSQKPERFPESPYLRAKRDWDERIGTSTDQAKNWRLAFVLVSALTAVSLASNFYQLTQNRIIPMVIAVGADSGAPTVIGKAGIENYQPGKPEIKYFLVQFLRFVRAVPVDPVVIKSNWLYAYKFLRPEAAQTLNAMTNSEEEGPLKKIGSETVTIQPLTVLYVAGSKSYQVRWTEKVFDRDGNEKDSYTMTGLFTLEIEPPTTEEEVLINPLGIFIKSFQWNRELEGKRK